MEPSENSGEQPIATLTISANSTGGTIDVTQSGATTGEATAVDVPTTMLGTVAGEPSLPALALAGRGLALRAEAVEVVLAAMRGGTFAFDDLEAPAEEPELVENESGNDVAVIPLKGMITPDGGGGLFAMLFGGGGGLKAFRASVLAAAEDDSVGHIVLDIDSPGGIVDMVPETAAFLREVADSKPITAVANTMAASAAYWLASQAGELVVTPSGEVGSIGVYVAHSDISKALDRLGENITLISAGKFKTEGNAYAPLDKEALKAIQDSVDTVYGMFVADVAEGRLTSEVAVRNGYGQGRMLRPPAATKAGLADRVATLDQVVTSLASTESEAASEPGGAVAAATSPDADQAETDALIELGRI